MEAKKSEEFEAGRCLFCRMPSSSFKLLIALKLICRQAQASCDGVTLGAYL
jgi:hypothetical protein